jgi:hypothetical protein
LLRHVTPLQWRVLLRGVGADPCVVVGDGEGGGADVGTDLYFNKLKERFGNVGVFCLSLLRSEGEEANVLHAFHDAAARQSINVINFDWHDQARAKGSLLLLCIY